MQFFLNTIEGERDRLYQPRIITVYNVYTGFLFTIIITVYVIMAYVSNHYIFVEEVFFRSYSDQLSYLSIENLLDAKQQYRWLVYLFLPVILLVKIGFGAVCISIGSVLSTIKLKFKVIFKTVLLAEAVFIVAQILYLVNAFLHLDTLTLETASNYYPLTVLSYLGTQNVVQWLHYPLQTLNLFEILYMIAIAWLLAKQWKQDFMESLAIVVPSYGTGLILWVVFVTFLTLQIS